MPEAIEDTSWELMFKVSLSSSLYFGFSSIDSRPVTSPLKLSNRKKDSCKGVLQVLTYVLSTVWIALGLLCCSGKKTPEKAARNRCVQGPVGPSDRLHDCLFTGGLPQTLQAIASALEGAHLRQLCGHLELSSP